MHSEIRAFLILFGNKEDCIETSSKKTVLVLLIESINRHYFLRSHSLNTPLKRLNFDTEAKMNKNYQQHMLQY